MSSINGVQPKERYPTIRVETKFSKTVQEAISAIDKAIPKQKTLKYGFDGDWVVIGKKS